METELSPRYVILCGGRDHPRFMPSQVDWLDTLHTAHRFAELVVGSDAGADHWGRLWAEAYEVNCLTFWANWAKYGRRAGPERNTRMLRYIMARSFHVHHDYLALTLVVVFPGGKGTADMCRQAQLEGVPVARWPDQGAGMCETGGPSGVATLSPVPSAWMLRALVAKLIGAATVSCGMGRCMIWR